MINDIKMTARKWFLKFFGKPREKSLSKAEKLTPEQIEQEKREFEAGKINRQRENIKSLVARCCERECGNRDNNKYHHIEKVFLAEKSEGMEYNKVIVECSFCGKIDYYYSTIEPEESLKLFLNEEFNK